MQKARITVSLRRELVEHVEAEVAAGKAPSVSAWVEDAIDQKAGRDDLRQLLDEMDAEYGPPSEEDYAWARKVLGIDEA